MHFLTLCRWPTRKTCGYQRRSGRNRDREHWRSWAQDNVSKEHTDCMEHRHNRLGHTKSVAVRHILYHSRVVPFVCGGTRTSLGRVYIPTTPIFHYYGTFSRSNPFSTLVLPELLRRLMHGRSTCAGSQLFPIVGRLLCCRPIPL